METEVWKNYDEHYLISNLGNVWSLYSGRQLKTSNDGYGYPIVDFHGKTLKVHRLVAALFLETPTSNCLTVNHKNGVKTDNRVSNLEWMTVSENNKHAGATGIMCHGESVHTARLTEKQVEEIKLLFVEYVLNDKEIAQRFKVSDVTISNIRRGLAWKHVRPDLVFKRTSPTGRKKLSGEDIPKIRKLAEEGHSGPFIAKIFKVHPVTINSILRGASWTNY